MTIPAATQSTERNPYLDARREWNERYGDHVAQAQAWKIVAIVALTVCGVATCGAIWLATQNRLIPYVVQVDRLGAAVAVRRADRAEPASRSVVRAQIARWVTAARTVYADIAAERAMIEEAYALINRNGAAYQALNEFMRTADPFERAKRETVEVQLHSVLPLSDDTWRVEWQERVRARDGSVVSDTPWQATVTVVLRSPTEERQLLINPMGVYVSSFSWSRRL